LDLKHKEQLSVLATTTIDFSLLSANQGVFEGGCDGGQE
jgi:hypothetical protein